MESWKTIKSKVAYSCKYLKILEEDFILPSGKKHRYHILDVKDYVIVIAKEKDSLYLIEQYRYTTKSKLLQVVAGAIEEEDAPLITAKKELKEEAGIVAKNLENLVGFMLFMDLQIRRHMFFLAEDLEIGKQKPDYFEKECKIKRIKLKISEVKKLIKSGKIKDHDTLSAFCLFMLKR